MTRAGCAFACGGSRASGARWMAASAPANQQPPRPESSAASRSREARGSPRRSGGPRSSPPARHRQLDVIDADDLDHGFRLSSGSLAARGPRSLPRRGRCARRSAFGLVVGFVRRLRGLRPASSPASLAPRLRVRRLGAFDFGVGRRAREPAVAAFHASMSMPAHGSKSDSSGSWPGRWSSGTWMRLTRTRYHSADRPRIPSTRMSAGSRYPDDLRMALLPAFEAVERLLLEFARGRSRRQGSTSCAGRSGSASNRPTRSAGRRWVAGRDGGRRSAATSGGGPPAWPRPGSYSDGGRRALDGWTRGGSPACFA